MNLVDVVVKFIKGEKQTTDVPEGFCPNCWGRQEYGEEFFKAIKNEQIDLNNVTEKKGWIQAYAVEHLEGIKLKKTEGVLECSACKLNYKAES
ncbi:MAG: hypothetical protein ACPGVB_04315 [Chitinophagales bacterium]